MYFEPITKQTFGFTTPISGDNVPQKIIASDLDNDERYGSTLQPALRVTPTLFESKQVQPAENPNTSTSQ